MKLFLIAHKVRGQPTFDIAEQSICVFCQSYESVTGVWCEAQRSQDECGECDGEGYWWIIPTSGHRAYPWRSFSLSTLEGDVGQGFFDGITHEMPEDLRDHYGINDRRIVNHNLDEYGAVISEKDKSDGRQLLLSLGLIKPKAPIVRRL